MKLITRYQLQEEPSNNRLLNVLDIRSVDYPYSFSFQFQFRPSRCAAVKVVATFGK
jgi:hypothetical protein